MDPRAPSAEEDRCLPPLQQRSPKMVGRGPSTSVHATCHVPRSVVGAVRERRACSARAQSGARMGFLGQLSMSCRSSHVVSQYGMRSCEEKAAGERSSINCESGACPAHITGCCGDGRFKLGGVLVCCVDVGGWGGLRKTLRQRTIEHFVFLPSQGRARNGMTNRLY
jgi:hypothetical protein